MVIHKIDITRTNIITLDDLTGLAKKSCLLKEIRDVVIIKKSKNKTEPYTPKGENLLNKFPDCPYDSLDQPSDIVISNTIYKNANIEIMEVSNNE
jgi:hypothetical protein